MVEDLRMKVRGSTNNFLMVNVINGGFYCKTLMEECLEDAVYGTGHMGNRGEYVVKQHETRRGEYVVCWKASRASTWSAGRRAPGYWRIVSLRPGLIRTC